MPITSSVYLNQSEGIVSTDNLISVNYNPTLTYNLEIAQSSSVVNTLNFLQFTDILVTTLSLNLASQTIDQATIAYQLITDKLETLNLNQILNSAGTNEVPLIQIPGSGIVDNPNTYLQFVLIQQDSFNKQVVDFNLIQVSKYLETLQTELLQFSNDQTLEVDLTLTDEIGPRLINLIPASGSSFINPNTNISFSIFDQEGSNVVLASIDIYVNNLLLISGGVNVCPISSGTVTLNQVTNSLYDFVFNPSFSFNFLNNPATVSGQVQDNQVIPNVTQFNYTFNVWNEDSLYATVSGSPDSEAPYLKDLNPSNLQVEVDIDSNIIFSITDDHTGVDLNSLVISVNSEILFISGSNISDNYFIGYTPIDSDRGFNFTLNKISPFNFNEVITVTVSGNDNFSISPNYINESYQFTTFANEHLTASGFEIFESPTWNELFLDQSYLTVASGTNFRITYYNSFGLGIDLIDSNIECNGTVISSTITPIISGYEYLVEFSLIPDYTTDCDLNFHIVQEQLVSGTQIYKNITKELLWGAEFCYNPDNNFTYQTDVPITLQIQDRGYLSNLNSISYQLTTEPMKSNLLIAEIKGIEYKFTDIISQYISNNPYFEYGKTMTIQLELEDFSGNKLDYTWSFKIEDK